MRKGGGREQFRVWVVTDGSRTKYIALCESQAIAFAKSYNELDAGAVDRVRVERRTAYFLAAQCR